MELSTCAEGLGGVNGHGNSDVAAACNIADNSCIFDGGRRRMSQILEHTFFGEKDGEDGKGTYWKKLDGSVAVPMTRGQTTFVGVLGIVVLFFTCLHI